MKQEVNYTHSQMVQQNLGAIQSLKSPPVYKLFLYLINHTESLLQCNVGYLQINIYKVVEKEMGHKGEQSHPMMHAM